MIWIIIGYSVHQWYKSRTCWYFCEYWKEILDSQIKAEEHSWWDRSGHPWINSSGKIKKSSKLSLSKNKLFIIKVNPDIISIQVVPLHGTCSVGESHLKESSTGKESKENTGSPSYV